MSASAAGRVGAVATGAGAALYLWRRRLVRSRWAPPSGRLVTTSTLAARVSGPRGDPVVLLHGLVGSSNYWGAAYDALAESHRLAVPDLLGFGRSPRPEHGYTLDDHVGALVGCLDDLDIYEPAVIVGHSLGVLVAVHLAATHPERVSAIVGFGPPLYPDHAAALRHVGATSPMGRLFVLPGRTAERACRWVCDHRKAAAQLAMLTHPSLPKPIAADSVEHTWASYSQTLEHVILSTAINASLHRVECPMRFVAGDEDRVVDLPYLRRLRSPSAWLALEEWRGGHDLPLSQASACVELIGRVAVGAVTS